MGEALRAVGGGVQGGRGLGFEYFSEKGDGKGIEWGQWEAKS